MISDPRDVRDLLERVQAGDAAALSELFARHRDTVRQVVALRLDRRLVARLDLSDVVQDTCLEAARRLPDYLDRPVLPFVLWLRWLARERVLMLHRHHLHAGARAVAREAPALPAGSSACFVGALLGREPSPSQAVQVAETAEKLRLAIGELDADERDLILWRHFEHLTNQEIARLLEISEAAAAKRYIRALERLRGLLIGLGVSGPP